jgi:hypothetical protein
LLPPASLWQPAADPFAAPSETLAAEQPLGAAEGSNAYFCGKCVHQCAHLISRMKRHLLD